MSRATIFLTLLLTLGALCRPAAAHDESAPDQSAFRSELLWSLDDAAEKLVSLAEAIPADRYGWRPNDEVRTVSEVFMHVAGGSVFLPTLFGVAPPEGIGRELEAITDKARVLETLERALAHARAAIEGLPDADFGKEIQFGGEPAAAQRALLQLVVHSHEHLGQAVAYARSIGVVPPWSGGGDGEVSRQGGE